MPILTSEISNSNRFLERFLVFREVLGGETRGEEVKGRREGGAGHLADMYLDTNSIYETKKKENPR